MKRVIARKRGDGEEWQQQDNGDRDNNYNQDNNSNENNEDDDDANSKDRENDKDKHNNGEVVAALVGKSGRNSTESRNYSNSGPFELHNFHQNFIILS